MKKTYCNICREEIEPKEVKRVSFIEATVNGDDQNPGLGSDRRSEGEVCATCADILHRAIAGELDPEAMAAAGLAALAVAD